MRLLEALPEVLPLAGAVPGTDADAAGLLPADAAGDEVAPPDRLAVAVTDAGAPTVRLLVAVALIELEGVPVRERVPEAEPEGVLVREPEGAGLPLPVAVVDAGAPGDSVLLAVWDTVALRDAVGENEEEPLRVGVSLLVGEPEMVHVPEPVAGAVRLAVEVMVAAPLLVGVADALTAALGVDVMELPPVDAEAEILASGVPAGLIPNDGAIDAATDADAAADAEAATLAVGVSAGLIPTDGAADAATLTRIDPAGVALGESTPGLNKAVGEALGDSPALDAGGGGLAVAELDAAPARGDGDGETSATTWTA